MYGQLVTEWLSESGITDEGGVYASGGDASEADEVFEDVGSAAKLQSRSDWEKTVFEPAVVDVDTLRGYLDSLFGRSGNSAVGDTGKRKREALQRLRQAVEGFEAELSRPYQFNHQSLKWTMDGLLSSNQLTNEKREVLKDFMGNRIILSEIADVLNMRLSAPESWNWEASGVSVEQRRNINGGFSIHMHEDLLQAVFL